MPDIEERSAIKEHLMQCRELANECDHLDVAEFCRRINSAMEMLYPEDERTARL